MNQNILLKWILFISLLILSISFFESYRRNIYKKERNVDDLIEKSINMYGSNVEPSDYGGEDGQLSDNENTNLFNEEDDDFASTSDEPLEKDMFYDQGEIILIMDSKTSIPIQQYPSEGYGKVWRSLEYNDLDNDGIPELIVMYFSGGAHCCFQYDIFSNIGPNKYERVYTYTGGENAFQINNGIIKVSFYEQLGYFYTCYACYINEELPSKHFFPSYNLIYKNKTLHIDGPNDSILNVITKDLEFLKNREIPPLEGDFEFDDGTRKAYASRIIAYYYNNMLDLKTTKELFYQTYLGSDRETIWEEIEAFINNSSNDNINDSIKGVLRKLRKLSVVNK